MSNTGMERSRRLFDRGGHRAAQDSKGEYRARRERIDSEVAAAVRAALTHDVFVPPTITARVRDGHVTLEGEVIWKFQRRMAELAVRTLAGVVGVHDGIKLASETKASRVKERVRASLQWDRARASGQTSRVVNGEE